MKSFVFLLCLLPSGALTSNGAGSSLSPRVRLTLYVRKPFKGKLALKDHVQRCAWRDERTMKVIVTSGKGLALVDDCASCVTSALYWFWRLAGRFEEMRVEDGRGNGGRGGLNFAPFQGVAAPRSWLPRLECIPKPRRKPDTLARRSIMHHHVSSALHIGVGCITGARAWALETLEMFHFAA